MQLKPLDEQVVVVFGASSGIGRVTAATAAARGASVVVSARGEPGLRSLVDEIQSAGGQAFAMPADTADPDAVRAVADAAVERFGRLDTWAHLAAVGLYAPFTQISAAEFKRVVEVNLLGQVYGAMAALPHLQRDGGGALVHVSSMLAKLSYPLQSPYCAAKHGIDGFVESLRLELRHDGVPVSVTQILPGSINTPLFDKARTKLGVKPTAPPPVYHPALVADAILYAAQHPVRDIVVGGAAQLQILGQRLAPRLLDAGLRRTGWTAQRSGQRKGPDAPDNVDQAVVGHDEVEDTITRHARRTSVWTWLETHPAVRRG
ncbi:MAG: SDR family oxidoreductase, partial [Actinomycetota bacterium]|nr:SDR family oxidoreductase [Actinomycetota bacterium]